MAVMVETAAATVVGKEAITTAMGKEAREDRAAMGMGNMVGMATAEPKRNMSNMDEQAIAQDSLILRTDH